jgi:hypothetical protein
MKFGRILMKLFTFLALATMAALLTATAHAQSSTVTLGGDPASAPTASVSTTVIVPPKPSTSNLIFGFKSATDSGRLAEMDIKGGRTAKSKNEAYLGYRFDNGWGAFYNAVNSYNSYYHQNEQINAKTKTRADAWSVGDPSITILHPDLFKSSNLIVFGQFRYYIPTTDRTVDKKINHFAYYLRLNAKFEGGHEIYNEIIPRYFGSTKYSATDTTNYVEDMTIYNYKIDSTGWKIGAKSWAQYEEHKGTGAGYSLEAGPQASYSFNSNLSISPSISFPLLKNNVVFDGPKAVATDQAYVSLFLQARL